MTTKLSKGLRGFLIDAPEPGRLRGIRDGGVWIEDGVIAAVGPFDDVRRTPGTERIQWQHSPEAVIIPGLIDLRANLAQYSVVTRVERQAKLAEREFNAAAAREFAPLFFEALARNGTTCAMLRAAASEESCEVVFEEAEKFGARVIFGMTLAGADSVLESGERLCRKWHGRDGGRLEYAFSPRDAVVCGEEFLREAGLLARKFDAFLQAPLAETRDGAVAFYADCGLFGDRSVLAHCIHLDDEEVRLLAKSRSAVAHCPTSDLFLNGGVMPLDCMLAAGLRVGLGSNVAGGPELDLWRVMRCSIESQKVRSFYQPGVRVPTAAEVFYLATLGGACALGKEALIGTLDLGKDADLVVLDLAQALPYGARGNVHCDLSVEEVITMLAYRGGPQTVVETFVRGTSIYRAPAPLLF
jgi:guanine deaminase